MISRACGNPDAVCSEPFIDIQITLLKVYSKTCYMEIFLYSSYVSVAEEAGLSLTRHEVIKLFSFSTQHLQRAIISVKFGRL